MNFKNYKIILKLQAFNYKQLIVTINKLEKLFKTNRTNQSKASSLPTTKKIYCILRSPHINKDAREHFEIRTFTKLFKIQIINFINLKLFIPSGIKITIVYCK